MFAIVFNAAKPLIVMLRSETIDRYKIVIPKDNAWEVLSDLGMLGSVEFIPHSYGYEMEKRNHKMLKHLEEILKTIGTISSFLQEQNVTVVPCQNYDVYLSNLREIVTRSGLHAKNYILHVAEVVKMFSEDITKNSSALSMLIEDLVRTEEELTISHVLKSSIPSNYR